MQLFFTKHNHNPIQSIVLGLRINTIYFPPYSLLRWIIHRQCLPIWHYFILFIQLLLLLVRSCVFGQSASQPPPPPSSPAYALTEIWARMNDFFIHRSSIDWWTGRDGTLRMGIKALINILLLYTPHTLYISSTHFGQVVVGRFASQITNILDGSLISAFSSCARGLSLRVLLLLIFAHHQQQHHHQQPKLIHKLWCWIQIGPSIWYLLFGINYKTELLFRGNHRKSFRFASHLGHWITHRLLRQ